MDGTETPTTSDESSPTAVAARATTRRVGIVLGVALVAYSVAILVMEWRSSQENARHYLGDISSDLVDGVDVTFYLVNTSLTVFALWTVPVLLLVALLIRHRSRAGDHEPADEARRFERLLWSQIGIFVLLGLDDRFQGHEKLAARLGDIPDHFVLGSIALVEVGFLLLFADRAMLREPAGQWFAAGAVGFAVMITIDATFPEDMRLRLSFEDLVKLWAAVCFALAAWAVIDRELRRALARR